MVKSANFASKDAAAAKQNEDENLDDESLEDESDEDNSFAESLAQSGLNIGQFLRSGKGEIQFGVENMDEEPKEPPLRENLKNVFNILTRSRAVLEVDEGDGGISDDIRSDFDAYKAHMEDITVEKDGGVFKRILQPGTGASAGPGKIVKFHYSSFIEGQDEPFDTSLIRGRTQKSKLGDFKLIPGLELGMMTMKEGELADFVIDHKYAYGEVGSLPMIPPSCTIRITARLVECSEEDAVDGMTMEKRQELPFKEAIAYIERKLEQGKLQFGCEKFNAAINRYKDARVQSEFPRSDYTEEEKLKIKELRIRLYKNLGTCYMKILLPNKVVFYLNKLKELGVRDSKTHFLQAKVCFMQGDHEKTLDELRSARVLEPGNVEIAKFMAKVMKEKSEYDERSKELTKRMFGNSPVKNKDQQ